jgi:hypothetical protein
VYINWGARGEWNGVGGREEVYSGGWEGVCIEAREGRCIGKGGRECDTCMGLSPIQGKGCASCTHAQ